MNGRPRRLLVMRLRLVLVLLIASLGLAGCLLSVGVTNSPPAPGESRPLP